MKAKNPTVLFALARTVVCLAAINMAFPLCAALEIGGLRCEHLESPLGLDVPVPRFSWLLNEAEATPGQRQTSYHILVATSPEKLSADIGDVWDSGRVGSHESHLVPLGAKAIQLRSSTQYFWKVRVTGLNDVTSAWSQPARFATGLFEATDWKGKWIAHPTAKLEQHTWFRKKVTLADAPASALLHVASLGYHELYINGQKVGKRVLAPALSRLDKRVLYVTYDIAPLLAKGENVIAIWFAAGWARYRENVEKVNPAIIAQLYGQDASGSSFALHTDLSWKTAESYSRTTGNTPMRMGDMGGEEVDGRNFSNKWHATAFDDSAWLTPVQTNPRKNKRAISLSAQMMEPSRIIKTFRATKVEKHKTLENTWIFDTGRNFTGYVEVRFRGLNSGDKISIKVSDRPDKAETFSQHQTYVARGEDGEFFRNRFNYVNGRYIQISGLRNAPNIEDLSALAISSAPRRTSSFNSSSALYNRIFETDLWTYEMCTTEGFTADCPSRERLGYGAESAYMTSWGAGLPSFDSAAFYRKNVRDWIDIQQYNGLIANTAPQVSSKAWGGPLSGSAIFNLAWEHYLAYGDKSVLESAFETEKKWLNAVYKKLDSDGIPIPGAGAIQNSGGFYLGDWLAPGHRQEKDGEGPVFFNRAVIALNLDLFIKTAEIIEKSEEIGPYLAHLNKLRQAMHKKYYKPEMESYFNGDQARTAFALFVQLPPQDEIAKVRAHLYADLNKQHPYFDIGSFARYPFFKTLLAEPIFHETTARILAKTNYPSYGHFLERGETTWPECWEIKNDDCARTHTSYTGISGWFIKCLAGIEPDTSGPGYRTVIIRPATTRDLSFATASKETPYGIITSGWKKESGKVLFSINIPVGMSAKIFLPPDTTAISQKLSPEKTEPGKKGHLSGEYTFFKVVSGNYQFTAPDTGK